MVKLTNLGTKVFHFVPISTHFKSKVVKLSRREKIGGAYPSFTITCHAHQ